MPEELPKDLPLRRRIDHVIEVMPGVALPTKAPYRMSHEELKELKVKFEEILAKGYIKPSKSVATPLWAKCEGEAHTPKSGKLQSFRTPENSELDCRGQISLHLSALSVIGKVLKCRCPKWPRMSHLDIYSSSFGQKKGRESNWQFDSRPLKVRNRHVPDVRSRSATWR
jgi:hypothetical protein